MTTLKVSAVRYDAAANFTERFNSKLIASNEYEMNSRLDEMTRNGWVILEMSY